VVLIETVEDEGASDNIYLFGRANELAMVAFHKFVCGSFACPQKKSFNRMSFSLKPAAGPTPMG